MMSYPELKKILFIVQTLLGAFMIALAINLGNCPICLEFSAQIACLTLLATGCICLLFGVTTFFLREDPDIWR